VDTKRARGHFPLANFFSKIRADLNAALSMPTDDSSFPGFEFEEWARLASEDPASFEEARRAMVESLIDAAPETIQPRLRGLQWQVDRLRELHNPMGACVKISNLMWHQVLGEDGLLDNVQRLGNRASPERPNKVPGKVLRFAPRH